MQIEFVTSAVVVMEYLTFPYREGLMYLAEAFETLLRELDIKILPVTDKTAQRAALIRAQYRGFKGMDALNLAVAKSSDCELFLTNDKQLLQFEELKCVLISDFS